MEREEPSRRASKEAKPLKAKSVKKAPPPAKPPKAGPVPSPKR